MSLAKVLSNSKIIINTYTPHLGQLLDDILFTDLLKFVGLIMKLKEDELQVAANSVKLFKGQTLTKELLQCITLRLTANKKFIKELVEIPYWEGDPTDATLYCKGITYDKEVRTTNRVLFLHCLVVTGIAAGLQVTIRKSANSINYLMYKYMKAGRGSYEAEEIAKNFFRCVIEESRNNLVDIKDVSVTPFMKELNKKVMTSRSDPQKCKTPNKLCWTCNKTISDCKNACKYSEVK